ncbi:MAG: bifunctional oligoribonuclease/PAP phosphatase NrnA [Chloroflexi bacterium]|nr:bifunctional oligoribonuclease/PAP phosphatase NrnA [Chloroflexota bacterium]MCL5075419.1 bifunctional oligoribonuclease/PAP phosphatase NrnA [Chloroflexota bacterium]
MNAGELIRDSNHITVVCHVSPDGDAIGTMLAFGFALAKLNKQCLLISPDPIPQALKFLPDIEKVSSLARKLPLTDLIITLEVGELTRLGAVYTENQGLFQAVPILNIDHHVTNGFFGTVNLVDPNAAALAEQAFLLFHDLNVAIDLPIATCLLTAVVTDTQCFRTPNTSVTTLKVAIILMETGASLSWIVKQVYKTFPLSTLHLWGIVLNKVQWQGKIVWASVPLGAMRKSGATSDQIEGLVDLLAAVENSSVAILFRETESGTVRVSLRSSDDLDVSEVAAHFNGGGHKRAAGFSQHGRLIEIQQSVIAYVDGLLSRG